MDDDLEVGESTRNLAAEMIDREGMENIVSTFLRLGHVRLFYCPFVDTLKKKFPFQSTLLSDLRVLNPTECLGYRDLPNAVIRLAKLFSQLQLCDKLDQLKTEAVDDQMGDGTRPPRDN